MRKFTVNIDIAAIKAKTVEITNDAKNKASSLDSDDIRAAVNTVAKNVADRTATDGNGQARLF